MENSDTTSRITLNPSPTLDRLGFFRNGTGIWRSLCAIYHLEAAPIGRRHCCLDRPKLHPYGSCSNQLLFFVVPGPPCTPGGSYRLKYSRLSPSKISEGLYPTVSISCSPPYPPNGSYRTNSSFVPVQYSRRIVSNKILPLGIVLSIPQIDRIQKLKRKASCDSKSSHTSEPAVARPPNSKPGKLPGVRVVDG